MSSVAGFTFMPAPGRTKSTISSPITSAKVVRISKYKSAIAPVLPTFFMLSMPEMPSTTVQKMMGAIIILMSLMNPLPNGCIAAPVAG